MKKSRYYRQMAGIDPAYADKYLVAAELWAKVEADQDRVDEDFQREEQQVELEAEAKRLNEVANRTLTESLVEEYLKPAAAQMAGLSPLVAGSVLMKVPHPAAKVAGGGLLLADALFGLGSNAAAKTDAALHGEEQPAWQEPTTGDRVMAGALLAMPTLRAISPTLSGAVGTTVGGGFMAEKVAATKAQLANAGLDSGIGDALAQTMTGPEIREIGMPGNQAVSSLMDVHMLRSGAGDLSHSKPVLNFLRKRGLGGAPEAIYRHAPKLSGFDSQSGRIEVEKPDIRLHEVGSDDRARIKSRTLTPEEIDALKQAGVDVTAFGAQSAGKILVNRAAIREAWENKQRIRLSEDESVVIDPREFKSLRDFRNAVVEHENQHIVTEGETPFKSGARPWSRGGFELDAGEKPTITALRRGVKQAQFREEQQYPPEARDWEDSSLSEEQRQYIDDLERRRIEALDKKYEAEFIALEEEEQRVANYKAGREYLKDLQMKALSRNYVPGEKAIPFPPWNTEKEAGPAAVKPPNRRERKKFQYLLRQEERARQDAEQQRILEVERSISARADDREPPPEVLRETDQRTARETYGLVNNDDVRFNRAYSIYDAIRRATDPGDKRQAKTDFNAFPKAVREPVIDLWLKENPDRSTWKYAREKKDSERELRTRGRVYSPRRSPEDTIDMWEREDRLNGVLPINPDRPKGKLQNIVKNAEVLPRPKPYYGVKRDWFSYGLRKSVSEFNEATKPVSRKSDLRDASFQIVPQKFGERIEGVIDGHRAKGKDITNAKPGEPGALGNPFVANDVRGGKLTRQQAVEQFERVFLDRVNKDKDFRDWILSLRGKKVGYYKPDEEHIHLKVVQDWLRKQSPAPRKVKLLDQWNSKEYGRQLEREEYEAARKKQMAEDNAAREEDGLGKGINPFKKDQPSYDSTYGDFLLAVRRGHVEETDLPNDYATLKAIARKTGLGKIEYISGEEAVKSPTMKQRILAALDDMTPQQIKDAFDRDGSKTYLPYSRRGNFPKDAVDIISDRLRNGEDIVLTTNSVHQGIHAKLTWDSKTREPVYDNQIYVAHDPATLLPKNSKMRYIATDHVTLTDEKLSGKLAEFDTLGEFVDWAAKKGIAKPYAKDAQGKTIVTNSEAADQTARAMAQHETAGESVRRPMFVDNRHYSPSEIARAIIDNTKLSKRIKALDKNTWMEYALEAVQGRTETELGITGKIKSRGPGINEEKAIDSWIKSRKRMNPELMRVKNEMEIRKAFVQAKGCTSEEAGFYTDENGMVKFMGDSLWSVKEMQEFVKENPPQKSSKTGGDRGYVDTTGEAEAEANAAEFGSDYTPVTSEIKSTTPGGSKIDLSSPTLWWKMARNSADKTPAKVASFVARLDKELGGLQPESKAKIARTLLDSALDPVSKAERLADEFTGKWQYAREAKGEKKQGLMAWGFLKMVDIAHAATSALMSMLSGREFMIEALDKAVSAFDSLKSGGKNEFGEPVTMSTKLFRWTTDVSEKLPREKWSMMRYAWEVMARKSDGEGYFKKIRSRNAKGEDVMEYHASLTGIRNAVRNMISEAVGRSREVDEMVRSTNILSLRRKLANDDAAVTDFGTYLTNRDLIKTAKLTSDQRAFLEAGVKLHDGVMDFMKALDPNWKPRQNYVTQLLKDFDDGLISDVQKLNTAERYALGNRLKRELGIGEADEDFANAAMKYKHPTIHARVYEYMQKVREAIRSDKRNDEGTEMYDMDGAATNSLDTTINQLLEYKLNQLFGTGSKAEGKVSIEEMIGEAGQGPSALFKRKIFGYGDMQETHADILVQRLVQSAHKNYPYHDLYRAMAAFTNGKEAPAVLKSAMNAALPDGFARLQKWSTSAIQNTFLSGLTGDVKRPTAFSKFTDYLMGTTTSYDPHPNNAAAHYWTSVIYRNFLTRPQFFMMNSTDPIIKTSFDGNFWEWATTVSRIYPQAIKEAVAARVTGKSSPLLSEAIKHIRAKGNVATELSGANLPSEQGAIFGNKAAKLGGIGLLFQKGWGTLTGGTEVQEHFNTASIWLIEAEKLLQRQIAKPKALIDQHGSLVRAAIEGKVNRETWNSVIKEATLRAEQRQGVGSDFMGKSEVFENFTATVGKNHPVMAMAIFARMFQNYPATVIAQLAKSTNRAILELRGKLDMTDTSSMTNILRTASPELLKAISPTALMMTAAVLSYQGGRALLTGRLTSSDYKEKDRKKQLKTVWSKLANIVGESGRLATRDLGMYQSMIPASFMKNIMLLASDPKVGASGLADMFIPGVFTGKSILRDAPKVPGLSSLFKKKND